MLHWIADQPTSLGLSRFNAQRYNPGNQLKALDETICVNLRSTVENYPVDTAPRIDLFSSIYFPVIT